METKRKNIFVAFWDYTAEPFTVTVKFAPYTIILRTTNFVGMVATAGFAWWLLGKLIG